jgi:hypothetical protein
LSAALLSWIVPEEVLTLCEVFVSYSWDSEGHTKAVLALSNRLRGDGIDCVIDQYEVSPPEGWPRWMDRKIAAAGLVLVVCTETYLAKINGNDGPDEGLGVKWEGGLIYQYLYNQGANNSKFIPVLMKASDKRFIPVPLQAPPTLWSIRKRVINVCTLGCVAYHQQKSLL